MTEAQKNKLGPTFVCHSRRESAFAVAVAVAVAVANAVAVALLHPPQRIVILSIAKDLLLAHAGNKLKGHPTNIGSSTAIYRID